MLYTRGPDGFVPVAASAEYLSSAAAAAGDDHGAPAATATSANAGSAGARPAVSHPVLESAPNGPIASSASASSGVHSGEQAATPAPAYNLDFYQGLQLLQYLKSLEAQADQLNLLVETYLPVDQRLTFHHMRQ